MTGAETMGRPKKGVKKAPPPTGERQVIMHLKGSPEYAAWLEEFHRDTKIPKATIVRWALAELAKAKGREAPPEI